MLKLDEELDKLKRMCANIYALFPSYITHIRFPRYKNLATDTKIEFSYPITALVGSNGSGKTSVLNALYGAPMRYSTGDYWFSTEVDPIEEGDGSPNRFIYGHYNQEFKDVVETRKARVRKTRRGQLDPNYWEPTKESPGDGMTVPKLPKAIEGRSSDRWNPVARDVLYINFRRELSAFDKYFYFGKDPFIGRSRPSSSKSKPTHRITNKKDRVRHDAVLLARVIASNGTSESFYNRQIATENRLLSKEELEMVSFVLGREYEEARWVKHRLFQGENGLSVVFKTKQAKYSEAFAGSGEVAVASCVVQVLGAKDGTLLLLDEPEVSLHPGAQERLLAFLARMAKEKKIQVVFSTHSPHLISALPDDAIKTFYQAPDGSFDIIPSTHPYAAFRRLGDMRGEGIHLVVEDRLAEFVVRQALLLIEDEAKRGLFQVEVAPGGASAILDSRIPVLMEREKNVFVLLDGDQKKVELIANPDDIPAGQDDKLDEIVRKNTGATPNLLIDGGAAGGNKKQRVKLLRKYLSWSRGHLRYIPTSCPEELVFRSIGLEKDELEKPSKFYKDKLRKVACDLYGDDVTAEDIDKHGRTLLAENRAKSKELAELKALLESMLAAVKIKAE